jgi:thymidine kinase
MATVVFGPMGAGKSTELYRLACRAALVAHNRVVVVVPCTASRSDNERAGASVIYTHRGLVDLPSNVRVLRAHDNFFDSSAILASSADGVRPTHVYVEELQFFEPVTLCAGIDHLLSELPSLELVLFGLRTDCEGRMWTSSECVSRIAGEVRTLSAVCGVDGCGRDAHFTGLRCAEAMRDRPAIASGEHYTPVPTQGSVPGGMSKYVPLCYAHMQRYLKRTGGALAASWPAPATRDP